MKTKVKARYPFTVDGIAKFETDTTADIMNELSKGGEFIDNYDIIIKIGNRSIRVPICADTHNELTELLKNAWEDDQQ